MSTELRWIASPMASVLHAAEAVWSGRQVADAAVTSALADASDAVARALAGAGVVPGDFVSHAIPLASHNTPPREVARVALTKTLGRADQAGILDRVAAALRELELAAGGLWPRLADELPLRIGPLRQQWEARGPGLLAGIGRLTEPELIVDRADVIVAQPVLGGFGSVHKRYNAVCIEAVLTNPVAELPEVARLAWLLSMLHLDLPRYSELIPPARLAHVASLSMLVPALESACNVELVAPLPQSLPRALEAWGLAAAERSARAETLVAWWDTYTIDRPPWRVALAALDQMLPA